MGIGGTSSNMQQAGPRPHATPRQWRRGAVVLTLGLAGLVSTTSDVAAQSRFEDVSALSCTFSLVVGGTWTDGEPELEQGLSTLSFQFVEIDPDGATAEAVGRFGDSHIITRLSGDYLHFLQLFNAGPLYSTTVIDRETAPGIFIAVHTRHEYTDVRLSGYTSRPEQYYGHCEAGE